MSWTPSSCNKTGRAFSFCLITGVLIFIHATLRWYVFLGRRAVLPHVPEGRRNSRMSSGPATPKLWQTTMRIRARNKRAQPLAFIGVQAGVNSNAYSSRRTDLRRAWFPADEAAVKRVEEDYGLIVRFVVGHTPSREHEVALQKEAKEFGPFLRLPINDTYEGLPWKTHAFVVTAFRLYNPKFVVKLDDDVYVRLDRLRLALAQYEERKFEFIGCMRREPIVSVPGKRYYEPDHAIFSSTEYHTYPLGSFYVLANSAAKMISSIDDINPAWLRHLASEDTMMGAWMLSLNVKVRSPCPPALYKSHLHHFTCNPHGTLTKGHEGHHGQAVAMNWIKYKYKVGVEELEAHERL